MSASIVIACHTEERWNLLLRAIDSATRQTQPAREIIVVVDHNDVLYERLRHHKGEHTVLRNRFTPGASGARNTGAFHASAPYVAFLDDDAAADPDWLVGLLKPFSDPRVVGTGGRVTAAWHGRRPGWLPEEFDWVVGASHRGMPTTTAVMRNVWAENMAVRSDVFDAVGGFRTGFGKLGRHSRPEDTDLCIRMSATSPDGRWIYTPESVVSHYVPLERASYQFFLARTYHEGRGKAELARLLPTPKDALTTERDYVRTVLPRGVVRHLRNGVVRVRPAHLERAANIVIGLASTVVGYMLQRVIDRFGLVSVPAPDAMASDLREVA